MFEKIRDLELTVGLDFYYDFIRSDAPTNGSGKQNI